jgi:predicted alpha/beta hydrolase
LHRSRIVHGWTVRVVCWYSDRFARRFRLLRLWNICGVVLSYTGEFPLKVVGTSLEIIYTVFTKWHLGRKDGRHPLNLGSSDLQRRAVSTSPSWREQEIVQEAL